MSQIWLVPAFPLLGFLLNGFLGKRFGTRFVTFVGPLAIALSFAQSMVLFFQMLEHFNYQLRVPMRSVNYNYIRFLLNKSFCSFY